MHFGSPTNIFEWLDSLNIIHFCVFLFRISSKEKPDMYCNIFKKVLFLFFLLRFNVCDYHPAPDSLTVDRSTFGPHHESLWKLLSNGSPPIFISLALMSGFRRPPHRRTSSLMDVQRYCVCVCVRAWLVLTSKGKSLKTSWLWRVGSVNGADASMYCVVNSAHTQSASIH